MKPENRNQLIRGKVVTGYGNTGVVDCTIKTLEDADRHQNALAVTPWYRHDELTECEKALKTLIDCYSNMPKIDGLVYKYEYKDYVKGV